MTNPPPPPTVADFIEVWHESLQAVVDVCEPLDAEQWQLPTGCPGWSVADVVAHVIDLEQLFGGDARPDHEPDWDALPHVSNDFARLTELGVDYRRGRSPKELLDELRMTIIRRRAQLESLPVDAEVIGPPAGKLMSLERFLRTRTFDTWVHEQDIRWAVGNDGGWNTAPAGVAFSQMANALPYVWGRNVKAPVGSVLQMSVIGPDMHHQSWVTVDEEGRGVFAPDETPPNLEAAMTWAAFMRLSAGRVAIDDPWLRDKVELLGDAELGQRLLTAMNIAP
jgi:uncharacterized protein (TIGR03083 family)